MDIDRIKLEARLFANEYLMSNLYAMLFRGSADPRAAVEAFAGELRRHMENFSVSGLEPVQSDTFAAEVRDALDVLINQIRGMVGAGGSQDGSQGSPQSGGPQNSEPQSGGPAAG